MSTFDKCIGCLDVPLKWEPLIALIQVKDSDNTIYFNVQLNKRLDCEDYSPAADCASPKSLIEMFASALVEDTDCGSCAINILTNCCEDE